MRLFIMPKPGKNESQSDWMSRCIPVLREEGRKQEQAVAICLSMWRERKKEMDEEVKGHVWTALNFWDSIKEWAGSSNATDFIVNKDLVEIENPVHPFIVWKDTETEEYRWLAIYSNKWRDEDNPPEILAEAAHKGFVEAVDTGDWPYPEAWLWHVPGTRFGVADFVAYDDNGFALASGTVDKGQEHVAENLSKEENLATSHGMPVKEIQRDEEDSTILTRYRTIEISPLPREAAANKHGTAIQILQEVKEMAIPENKRPFLAEQMGEKGLEDLEARLADKAKELEVEGVEFKEEDAAEEAEQVEEPVEEPEEIGEEEDKEITEEVPEYVTATEVAEAVGAYLKPLVDQVAQLATVIEEQEKELKELRKGDEERIEEIIKETPAASLFDRIGSVIGSDDTYIDGRSKLAKSGPKETEDPDNEGPTSVGIINELMAQSWGG